MAIHRAMWAVSVIVIIAKIARKECVIIMELIHAIIVAIPESIIIHIAAPKSRIIRVIVAGEAIISKPGIPGPIRTPVRSVVIVKLVLIKAIITPIRIYPIWVIPIRIDIKTIITLIIKRIIKSA
jgi:hypothetical protein